MSGRDGTTLPRRGDAEAASSADIRAHWERAARGARDADGLSPTARDPYLQEVVEHAIAARIPYAASLLDIGCGSGGSTLAFAACAARVVGADYVADFIRAASAVRDERGIGNAEFVVGDVTDLAPIRAAYAPFDVVTTIRCLINLPDWRTQSRAIAEIARCVKPGGLYLTSEGWLEGHATLNEERERAGLGRLRPPYHNLLISRKRFERRVRQFFDIEDYASLGLYSFIARVVQPAFTRPDPPRHTHDLNRVASELVRAGVSPDRFRHCDYAGVYVLRRRGVG